MAEMTEHVRAVFEKQGIVVLATSSKDGTPNAVPVGAKKVIDNEREMIWPRCFYFPKTVDFNIDACNQGKIFCCINN